MIASDCAGNREQIVDGEDGLLCTLTPEGIAEKVEELLDDPKKRERLAAAAKQKMIFYSIKKLEKRKVKDKESL